MLCNGVTGSRPNDGINYERVDLVGLSARLWRMTRPVECDVFKETLSLVFGPEASVQLTRHCVRSFDVVNFTQSAMITRYLARLISYRITDYVCVV